MAQNALYDLTLKLTANSAELTKGLKEANTKLDGFQNKYSGTLSTVKTSSVAAAGIAVGAFKILEGILKSTGTTSDNLGFKIDGLKGVAQASAQMIATLDFSRSLKDAYDAAEELAEKFDELDDRQLSLSMISADNKNAIAKLKADMKDVNLTVGERKKKEEEISNILIKEAAQQEDIANDKLAAINTANAKNYKVTVETAALYVDYLKSYDNLTDEQRTQLNLALQLDRATKEQKRNSGDLGQLDVERTSNYQAIKDAAATLPEELKKYLPISNLILDKDDERKQQIADIYIGFKDTNTALINMASSVDRYGNKLDKADDKAKGLLDTVRRIGDAQDVWSEQIHVFSNTGDLNSNQPIGKKTDSKNIVGLKPQEVNTDLSNIETNLQNIQNAAEATTTAVDGLGSSFQSLGQMIGGATGSFMSWFGSLIGNIPTLVSQYDKLRQASILQATANQGEAISGAVASGAKLVFPYNLAAIAIGVSTVLSALSSMPKYATGTDYSVGGWSVVGEQGMEAVQLPRGSKVKSHKETMNMMNGTNVIGGELTTKLRGNNIEIILKRTAKEKNAYK